jgi:glycine cleavage system transcriptional repressor
MAKAFMVITAVGRDRRGTVEMITDVVVNHSANIEESRMARLGGEFAVIMLLSLPDDNRSALEKNLKSLNEKGLTVISRQTDLSRIEAFKGYVPYEIAVIGADHEGIVNRVARYLASEQINIEEMDIRVTNAPNTGTPLFSMNAKVQAPPQLSLNQLRKKLAVVGDELDVDIEVKMPLS